MVDYPANRATVTHTYPDNTNTAHGHSGADGYARADSTATYSRDGSAAGHSNIGGCWTCRGNANSLMRS